MKNLKKYMKAAVGFIAAASLGISSTSCDNLLDTKPQGAFTTEQIGDEEDDRRLRHPDVPLLRQ